MLYNYVMKFGRIFFLLTVLSLLCFSSFSFKMANSSLKLPLSSMAQQLASNTNSIHYSMTTSEGYNMDCLKVIFRQDKSKLGVFHSSKGQSDSYNRLYATIQNTESQKFAIVSRISDRGSQGTIFTDATLNGAYLIAYELQNHQHGNTFAIRYYESYQHIKANDFLYEYQLQQKVDNKQVRNVGTPSIQSIQLVCKQYDPKFSQYSLKIKFHYSPDGSHDLPGYGTLNLIPLRDFIDKNGQWIGGCKQAYSDWKGSTDTNVLNAMRKIGVNGKVGQRDSFSIQNSGKTYRYYLYEANLYADFDWKNWRIFLYGETQNQVIPILFVLDKVVDLANPHITVQSRNGSQITFQMSFFLPSQGMQPQSSASPGQVMVKSKIIL